MKATEFRVTGKTPFPADMLRYDACWPSGGLDVDNLCLAIQKTYTTDQIFTIKLVSFSKPTVGRWESFGWEVSQ